ncbi:hypothetical protein VST7929_00351 [Vibrio stylophorae]|uniref:BON domain-containing protein n=1 Tax=Vibrio stylophorae TaxID=659351 RepID=A0ABM8ZQH2_9VIBR|nr:division/outer membrane stress-associated lipid-binding lipoprotein [Vibrio stylophorae]CAH0532521.1 hypothetical protein VST7929_00351 [Vibrio stylophorae]
MKRISLILLCTLTLLQGCAGVILAGAAGTALVVSDPRTPQEQWHDQEIEMEVGRIVAKPEYRAKLRIQGVSYGGKVLLVGQSTERELLDHVIEQVRRVNRVQTVYNLVRLEQPLTLAQISEDTWITTKVRTQMLADERLKSMPIKVVTENKEVFLLGYIDKNQADIAVDIARHVSGVKQVIKAFEYVEPKPVVTEPAVSDTSLSNEQKPLAEQGAESEGAQTQPYYDESQSDGAITSPVTF